MENTIKFYIEKSQERIEGLEKEIAAATNDYSEMWLKGSLCTEQHKLEVLNNLLKQQQYESSLLKGAVEHV